MPNRRGFREIHDFEELRVHGRLTAGNLYDVRVSFVAPDGVQHLLNQSQVTKLLALGPARRVTRRAAQVAVVTNLYQRKARGLLMVGAEAAIVGASPFHRRVVNEGHLRRLDEDFAATPVVVDIVGDQYALMTVFRAALEQIDVSVLENGLRLHFPITGRADGNRNVVEEIGTFLVTHRSSPGETE